MDPRFTELHKLAASRKDVITLAGAWAMAEYHDVRREALSGGVAVQSGGVAAQVVEQLAQVRASLRLARLGPQKKREVFAGLRGIGVQHQKRQQRL